MKKILKRIIDVSSMILGVSSPALLLLAGELVRLQALQDAGLAAACWLASILLPFFSWEWEPE